MDAKSQLVKAGDAAKLVALVAELGELSFGEPGLFRQRLADGIVELIPDSAVFLATTRRARTSGAHASAFEILDGQFIGATAKYMQPTEHRYVEQQEYRDDPVAAYGMTRIGDGPFVFRRRELLSDTDWHQHPHLLEFRKPGRIDDIMVSFQPEHCGLVIGIGLNRFWGGKPYTERDGIILHLLHIGLQPLVRRWIDRMAAAPIAATAGDPLPRRLEQTLGLALKGCSEQEIGDELGLSKHTVHQHICRLYRRFGVNSRAQLLAVFRNCKR